MMGSVYEFHAKRSVYDACTLPKRASASEILGSMKPSKVQQLLQKCLSLYKFHALAYWGLFPPGYPCYAISSYQRGMMRQC
jgi:hypothetical protein